VLNQVQQVDGITVIKIMEIRKLYSGINAERNELTSDILLEDQYLVKEVIFVHI
jgi:hypothetical protein